MSQQNKTTLVVTSINAPNDVLKSLADGAHAHNYEFIVIGDGKSPDDFELEHCRFVSLADQQQLDFAYAKICPVGHYARKNIGYLMALSEGSDMLIETDDDNYPREAFFAQPELKVPAHPLSNTGWVNVYGYFTDSPLPLWPRGLPLNEVQKDLPPLPEATTVTAPIQQGLADDNPDVDAIYRLLLPLPQVFNQHDDVALDNNAWCPFNSQNTKWFKQAAPLLYLPATCSFRMTDIWRSFVAQRIAWENGWQVLFTKATVWQERNEHNLMRDFADEVPGYLHNDQIASILQNLDLPAGEDQQGKALRMCYAALVEHDLIDASELDLIDAWLADLAKLPS